MKFSDFAKKYSSLVYKCQCDAIDSIEKEKARNSLTEDEVKKLARFVIETLNMKYKLDVNSGILID